MDEPVVIARAYGGEPLRRIAVRMGRGCIYLVNPASLEAVRLGESSPIGFPESDVFYFNSDTYEKLCAEWASARVTSQETWRALYHFTFSNSKRAV